MATFFPLRSATPLMAPAFAGVVMAIEPPASTERIPCAAAWPVIPPPTST